MAEFQLGQLVFSKRGRDKELPFIIIKIEGEYIYLSDGSLRKLEKLKKKKMKHVQPTKYIDWDISRKIQNNTYLLDADIRKSIVCYSNLKSSDKEVK